MLEILLWISILIIIFAYFGYPASLILIGMIKNKVVDKDEIYPYVTMIVAAFNEERKVENKICNTLKIEYPKEKFQVIFVSDESTDKTDEIISKYICQGIEYLRIENRKGKENAQKEAIKYAKGDIIIFSDVATAINSNGIKNIVSNFADPSVGCVSSEDRIIKKNGSHKGEGTYVSYEMWLRKVESKVHSIVGLSGSFFAARKEVCKNFSSEMQSDFRTVLNSIELGLRGVCDSEAIGYYENVADEKREFDRKVRTVIRGLTVFFRHMEFLNPFVYGIFSYELFCHKLLRWLVPLFLIIVFYSNTILAFSSSRYFILLICQVLFYSVAFVVRFANIKVENTLFKIPVYFSTVNLSILVAWWKYIKGKRIVMWSPSER